VSLADTLDADAREAELALGPERPRPSDTTEKSWCPRFESGSRHREIRHGCRIFWVPGRANGPEPACSFGGQRGRPPINGSRVVLGDQRERALAPGSPADSNPGPHDAPSRSAGFESAHCVALLIEPAFRCARYGTSYKAAANSVTELVVEVAGRFGNPVDRVGDRSFRLVKEVTHGVSRRLHDHGARGNARVRA
jgi:hypothetical protein